jgi:hypothetical protein
MNRSSLQMNRSAMRWVVIVLSLLAASSSAAQGLLIAYEGFNYPASAALQGANGGTGWSGAWLNSSLNNGVDNGVASGSMVFTGLPTSGGRLVTHGGTDPLGVDYRSFRHLDLSGPGLAALVDTGPTLGKDGTSIWIAFLAALSAGANSNGGFGGIHLYQGLGDLSVDPLGDKINHERVFMGDAASFTHWFLGRTCGGCMGATIDESAVTVSATVRLLVYRFDFLPGNETVHMFIDPPLNVVPNDTTAAVVQTQFLDFRFDTIEVGTGNGSPQERMDIDELRIGTTFFDVVGRDFIFANGFEP